jgi:hypothetical protein
MTDFTHALRALRADTCRLGEHPRKVQTFEDAVAFINEVGLCLFFGGEGDELPTLVGATGQSINTAWNWKDDIPAGRLAYYGRAFRKRRTGFVRLDLLPAVYALSPLHDCGGDRFELFSRGILDADANRLAGILAAKGPLSTRELRREAGLAGKQHKARFTRAIYEAEGHFLAAVSDIAGRGIGSYSYLWDTFDRTWPEVVPQAAALSFRDAARAVIGQYVRSVHATTPAALAATFHLEDSFVLEIALALEADGVLGRVSPGGQVHLASPALLERL